MKHPIYEVPPLAEIVAEVRWGEALKIMAPGTTLHVQTLDDSLFIAFGIEAGKQQYTQLERVFPSGLPVPPGAIVYRYRKSSDHQNTLFQLGAGIFSVNGLPPYDSWKKFRAVVEEGLRAAVRVKAVPSDVPVQLTLRYIDAFSGHSLLGRTPFGLFSELMALQFSPPAVAGIGEREPQAVRLFAEYSCLENGVFSIEVGQGKKDDVDALILTTSARSALLDHPEPDLMIQTLDELQQVLHDAFDQLVSRVPVGGGDQ